MLRPASPTTRPSSRIELSLVLLNALALRDAGATFRLPVPPDRLAARLESRGAVFVPRATTVRHEQRGVRPCIVISDPVGCLRPGIPTALRRPRYGNARRRRALPRAVTGRQRPRQEVVRPHRPPALRRQAASAPRLRADCLRRDERRGRGAGAVPRSRRQARARADAPRPLASHSVGAQAGGMPWPRGPGSPPSASSSLQRVALRAERAHVSRVTALLLLCVLAGNDPGKEPANEQPVPANEPVIEAPVLLDGWHFAGVPLVSYTSDIGLALGAAIFFYKPISG